MSLNEAKSLLKEGGDVIKPLYEYWINKRKKLVRKYEAYIQLTYSFTYSVPFSHQIEILLYSYWESYTDMIIGN